MRRPPATDKPNLATVWLCGLLLLVVGLSQQLVLCTPEGGQTQIEFVHDEGDCCEDAAVDRSADDPVGGDSATSDPHCEHLELAIEVGSSPNPDFAGVPPAATATALPVAAMPLPTGHAASSLPPPATGPPRPEPWLAHLRTRVLLV